MMTALSIPAEALQSLFQMGTTVDLRNTACPQPSSEVVWLLIPVHVAQLSQTKDAASETPTRIEFAPLGLR